MAEIITAKTAGFCFGVKKAVEEAFRLSDEPGRLYTYGPVIHNDAVMRSLSEKGVICIEREEDLLGITDGTVLLRSHGVPRRVIEALKARGIDYVDVCCPFVKRIHEIVAKESRHKQIVIAGDARHPEVEGIMGWCERPAQVLSEESEARAYVPPEALPVCVVAQTTFHYKKFQKIVEIFEKKSYDVTVVDTICNATVRHQTEAREIAGSVDAMIVIGDSKSSNSAKLFEICKKECDRSVFIQDLSELTLKQDGSIHRLGITAGASTPNYIIEEVQKHVRREF